MGLKHVGNVLQAMILISAGGNILDLLRLRTADEYQTCVIRRALPRKYELSLS